MTGAPDLAIATNNGDVGGGEVMLLAIARALRELGLRPLVLAPRAPDGVVAAACAEGLEVHVLPVAGRRAYLAALRRWRRRNSRLPLWCNGLVPALATAGLGPRVVHLHRLPEGIPQRLAARVAAHGARAVLVPSQFLAARCPGSRVLADWTAEIPAGPASPRSGAPAMPAVGFLGRVTAEKGADVLAAAVDRLAQEGREVRLVIAGEARFAAADDPAEPALARLGDRVEHLGWVAPEELLGRVDLLVVPSVVPESFGLVVAEALAARCPVVITAVGALPEVLGPVGVRPARPGDPADLARAIREVLDEDPVARGTRVAAGRVRWEREFSPAAGRERVAQLLEDLDLAAPADLGPRR